MAIIMCHPAGQDPVLRGPALVVVAQISGYQGQGNHGGHNQQSSQGNQQQNNQSGYQSNPKPVSRLHYKHMQA
jgi:hypothetical protein